MSVMEPSDDSVCAGWAASIQESPNEMENQDEQQESQKNVMRKEEAGGQTEKEDAHKAETMTMTMGSKREANEFLQLPPELLALIVTHLAPSPSDLLTCRQVNSTWKKMACGLLQQSSQITLEGRSLFADPNTSENPTAIERLTSCLENCQKIFDSLDTFPCLRFKLIRFSLEEDPVQLFFDLYGPSIESLELQNTNGHLETLHNLLVYQAPNLKHLTHLTQTFVKRRYWRVPDSGPFDLFERSGQQLPHLESLSQGGQFWREPNETVMAHLVKVAPNLKTYQLLGGLEGPVPFDTLVSSGKMHTLKKLETVIVPQNLDLCEKFANLHPTLESLSLRVESQLLFNGEDILPRAVSAINKILNSSQHTLHTLRHFYSLALIPGIIFPVFDKINKLNPATYEGDRQWRSSDSKILPPNGLRFDTIFPNLKTLNFKSLNPRVNTFWEGFHDDDDGEIFFCPAGVRKLTISWLFEKYMDRLSRFCPNLKILKVHCEQDFPFVCRQIFEHLKGLEELEFFGVDCSRSENKFPALDSGLTGFSLYTCRRLAKNEDVLEDQEAEKLRENFSILELTGLRTLKLTGVRGFDSPFLSRVSGIWAFRRMPHLKIFLAATGPSETMDGTLKIQATMDAILSPH